MSGQFVVSSLLLISFFVCRVSLQCLSEDDEAGPSPKESSDRMSQSSLEYTTDQFKRIVAVKPGENVFISPYSLWSALTLTYLGAKGETGQELAKVLGFDGVDRVTVGRGYLELNKSLKKAQTGGKSTLALANKIIFDDEVNVRECMVRNYYDSLARVNLTLQPSDSRLRINGWVQHQTKDKIKNLIPSGGITSQTKMVIVNAVYFKGEWLHMFNKSKTMKGSFQVSGGAPRLVDMMSMKSELYYGENEDVGVQAVELPYSGEGISMVILLPTEGNNVGNVVSKLTSRNLQTVLRQMIEADVTLTLPKFKMEDGYDMVDLLRDMGVKKLFSDADLSGYTDESLAVSSVIHKAIVEVNEEGTEAAGSTAVIMSRTSRILGDVTMNVNRPFVFLIRDVANEVVLFMGVVNQLDGQTVGQSPGLNYF